MTKLEEIEKAVAALTPEELAAFRDWFDRLDGENWDEQIQQDAASGKLAKLAEQAVADHQAGRTRKI